MWYDVVIAFYLQCYFYSGKCSWCDSVFLYTTEIPTYNRLIINKTPHVLSFYWETVAFIVNIIIYESIDTQLFDIHLYVIINNAAWKRHVKWVKREIVVSTGSFHQHSSHTYIRLSWKNFRSCCWRRILYSTNFWATVKSTTSCYCHGWQAIMDWGPIPSAMESVISSEFRRNELDDLMTRPAFSTSTLSQ